MKLNKNDILTLEIIDINNLGFGVAKHLGQVIFVAGAVSGEIVEARVIKTASSYAVARLERIIKTSPCRTNDRCQNIKCSSCTYKYIDYDYELKLKENTVKAAFLKAGLKDIEVMPTVPSPDLTAYRNKAQYPVARAKNGEVLIGFYAPKTHRVCPAIDCPLAKEGFAPILKTLKSLIEENDVSLYDEESKKGLLRHIYLRANDDGSEVLLTLVVTSDNFEAKDVFVKSLILEHPELVGILLNINPKDTNVILGEKYITLWGKDHIIDTLCGVKLMLKAPAFYQINHGTATAIYKKARELAEITKEDTVLDIYCGVGSIGLSMAEDAKEIIGIEIVPDAIECAKKNAATSDITNASFYVSDAKNSEEILSLAEKQRGEKIKADIVILDPPRAGCDEKLINYVSSLNLKRIVYVSCNPQTLARDVVLFREKGYDCDTVWSYDMFPMTGHVESVVCLKRRLDNELQPCGCVN